MKKILLSSAALLLSAAVPAGFAATHGRVMTTGIYQAGVSRVGGKFVSRRQVESGVWSIRARTRTGYTHPTSFITDKKDTPSSSANSTSSTSSSAMSSSAMSSSSMSHNRKLIKPKSPRTGASGFFGGSSASLKLQ